MWMVFIHKRNIENNTGLSEYKQRVAITKLLNMKLIETKKKYTPSILILDLDMPEKNGLEVLKEIESFSNYSIRVIIISGEISMVNRLNFKNYRAIIDIFIKLFEFKDLYSRIQNIDKNNTTKLESYIDELLHEFSFNFTSTFYEYLLICIKKAIYRPLVLNNIYKEVAKENDINFNRLKWGIQKLIVSMVRYTPATILKKYFPYTSTPSPKLFIYEIVRKVKEKIL